MSKNTDHKVKKGNFNFKQSKSSAKYAIVSKNGKIFVLSKLTTKNDGFVNKGIVNLQTKSFWEWMIKKEIGYATVGAKIIKIK